MALEQLLVSSLHPHPQNPRFGYSQEVVDQIVVGLATGFDEAHALIVRKNGKGYQIVSGHHRAEAARQAGLKRIPCWVREYSDQEAFMQLVLCNAQSELHALEEGRHAVASGLKIREYAELIGKKYQTILNRAQAYKVYQSLKNTSTGVFGINWIGLSDIYAAPKWLWSTLGAAYINNSWTQQKIKTEVAKYKGAPTPEAFMDIEAFAEALIGGYAKVSDLTKITNLVNNSGVTEDDLHDEMLQALGDTRPVTLSAVQEIVAKYQDKQRAREKEARDAELAKQRESEEISKRIQTLRENCSLDQWAALSEEEQEMLLNPESSTAGFNAQKNESIEWAQWSWNPVTGCKHNCPYCYARDIALGARMAKAGLYPNGWEPNFRSESLLAPYNVKIPKEAAQDTRYKNVFTCSMADLFGKWVPAGWIDAVFKAVLDNPDWNFLFLTKFPQRYAEFEVPENAWIGTTVDLQARVKNAEKAFRNLPYGGVKWLSVEPMLEELVFEDISVFDWVVIGGASASTETPVWVPPFRWVERLVRQCDDAGVPVYMKTNLGIENRVLDLPFKAPIIQCPQKAPEAFNYLKRKSK